MPSYDVLHKLAGLYNPGLGLLCLIYIAWVFAKGNRRLGGHVLLHLVSILLIVYGFMALDRLLLIDSVMGFIGLSHITYSTHSAAAIAGVSFLTAYIGKMTVVWLCSLLMYLSLVVYQRYHTVEDVIFTALLVLPLCAWLMVRGRRRQKMSHTAPS